MLSHLALIIIIVTAISIFSLWSRWTPHKTIKFMKLSVSSHWKR